MGCGAGGEGVCDTRLEMRVRQRAQQSGGRGQHSKIFQGFEEGVEATVFKSGNSISVRLPKVIADLYHLNTNLKLPIETELGRIRLKIVRRKMEA
ncbi:MAG: hypothetical protein Q8O41_00575 [Candidatus Methanoperedens sp.]|nr:hypothetical protein [Candidatus Methanoperedens sp.]